MYNVWYYTTKIGKIGIVEKDSYITNILFENSKFNKEHEIRETCVIKTTYIQICEYLDKKRKSFDVAIKPEGTEFMKSVWNQLVKIPYGNVSTYKDIAIAIGNKKATRAVGMANNKNPIPIIIPCHRVIGTNTKLVGYAGGLDIKEALLKIEGNTIENEKVIHKV